MSFLLGSGSTWQPIAVVKEKSRKEKPLVTVHLVETWHRKRKNLITQGWVGLGQNNYREENNSVVCIVCQRTPTHHPFLSNVKREKYLLVQMICLVWKCAVHNRWHRFGPYMLARHLLFTQCASRHLLFTQWASKWWTLQDIVYDTKGIEHDSHKLTTSNVSRVLDQYLHVSKLKGHVANNWKKRIRLKN